MNFVNRLGGISRSDEQIRVHFHSAAGDLDFTTAALKVDGPVRLRETIFGSDFRSSRPLWTVASRRS